MLSTEVRSRTRGLAVEVRTGIFGPGDCAEVFVGVSGAGQGWVVLVDGGVFGERPGPEARFIGYAVE